MSVFITVVTSRYVMYLFINIILYFIIIPNNSNSNTLLKERTKCFEFIIIDLVGIRNAPMIYAGRK